MEENRVRPQKKIKAMKSQVTCSDLTQTMKFQNDAKVKVRLGSLRGGEGRVKREICRKGEVERERESQTERRGEGLESERIF